LPNEINKKGRAISDPAFSLLKLFYLLFKLLSRSPKTEQTRPEKKHGDGFRYGGDIDGTYGKGGESHS